MSAKKGLYLSSLLIAYNFFVWIIVLSTFLQKNLLSSGCKKYLVLKNRLSINDFTPKKIKRLWIHAASLGEVKMLTNLMPHLKENHIIISVNTETAYQFVENKFPRSAVVFTPLDSQKIIKKYIKEWNISKVIYIENEIMPNSLETLKKQKIPIHIVGLRKSKSRLRLPGVYSYFFSYFTSIGCSSDSVYNEVANMPLPLSKIFFDGSLKIDISKQNIPIKNRSKNKLNKQFFIAVSTHPEDELILIDSIKALNKVPKDIRFIIAPRHKNRVPKLIKKLKKNNLRCKEIFSRDEFNQNEKLVYVLNYFGDMDFYYSIANYVYIGGGIGHRGGHNPLEVAIYKLPILSGKNVHNWRDEYELLTASGLVYSVDSAGAIINHMEGLFTSSDHNDNQINLGDFIAEPSKIIKRVMS